MSDPSIIDQLLDLSAVHPEWRKPLQHSLQGVDSSYLQGLVSDSNWLPGRDRLLAAFQRDMSHCRYILFGESPYPRLASANGIAFHDAAVGSIWSDKGLSKAVNRATSLRNIIKTALLAEGRLRSRPDGSIPQPDIAAIDKAGLIDSLEDLFRNLQSRGFLMFNATPVLHPERKPRHEARYWKTFINRLLQQISDHTSQPPTLLLWGKIAEQIAAQPGSRAFPHLVSEHPYNLSFIHNPDMQALFADLRLLEKPGNE